MAFQAVIDTAEIDVLYTYNGKFVQNTFYAELPGGYTLTDLQALATAVDARVGGNFKALQPLEAIYIRTEVRGLAVENDLTASDGTNNGPGLDAAAALPNNVTISIKKESGLTGRSARGRCFWIGIARTQTTPGNENLLDATYVANVVAAVDQIRDGIADLPLWNPVLVSRFSNKVQRPTGLTFPWISNVAVDTIVDTARGRLP